MDIQELDQLCINLIELEEKKEKISDDLKEVNKEITTLSFKLSGIFLELGKIENSGTWGKVNLQTIPDYRATDIDIVYDWLKKEGRFDKLAKIHAGTLKSTIKKEIEKRREMAKDSGSTDPRELYWLPDGVEEKEFIKVKVSKS